MLNDAKIQTIIAAIAVVISFFGIYEFRSWINLEYNTAVKNAEILFQNGEYEKAKDKFLLALNEKPHDTYSLGMLEQCKHQLKVEEAEKIASKYFFENNFEYALSYYEQLTDLQPNNLKFIEKVAECKAKIELSMAGSKKGKWKNYSVSSNEHNLHTISEPINNLFEAWTDLDLDFYMAQWSQDAFQYSKSSQKRNYQDLLDRRRSLFSRLNRVTVTDYHVYNHEILDKSAAILYVNYSMEFELKTGKKIVEKNINEKYVVKYDIAEKRWLIFENFDYVG